MSTNTPSRSSLLTATRFEGRIGPPPGSARLLLPVRHYRTIAEPHPTPRQRQTHTKESHFPQNGRILVFMHEKGPRVLPFDLAQPAGAEKDTEGDIPREREIERASILSGKGECKPLRASKVEISITLVASLLFGPS